MFARHGVIMPLDGKPTLMLRAANARQNIIMEAQAHLRLLRDELTVEGFRIRRIYDLTLRRYQHPVFLFGWNLLHVIDESSPLYGQTSQSMAATRSTVLLTVSGTGANLDGEAAIFRLGAALESPLHRYPDERSGWRGSLGLHEIP